MILKKIAIVGLGLMGGSLAAACREQFPEAKVVGVSRSLSAIAFARKKKWIHEGSPDLVTMTKDADFVVLCTPVQIIPELLKQLDRILPKGARVTDVGSVKNSIQKKVQTLRLQRTVFVGAHPFVGSHCRGIEVAQPDLYKEGLTFVIKPARKTKAYVDVKAFWKKISGRIIELNAKKHDQIVGKISHLPHLLAACLIQSISPEYLPYASSGLRDTTRIAGGHESIWQPIFLSNRKAVDDSIESFKKQLNLFQVALRKGDASNLQEYLKKARQKRQKI